VKRIGGVNGCVNEEDCADNIAGNKNPCPNFQTQGTLP